MRGTLRCLAALFTTALLTTGPVACSGRDGGAGEGSASFGFNVISSDVEPTTSKSPAFPRGVKVAVTDSLDTYLRKGMVEPLSRGQPPAGLEDVFTDDAAARLHGPDRAALVEDGTPVTGTVRQDRAEARLIALTDDDDEPAVVTAEVDVALTVSSARGRLAVTRTGALVLVADDDIWRIDSYDLQARRDSVPGGGSR